MMNRLESLVAEYDDKIKIEELSMPMDGLYGNGVCWLNTQNPYHKKLCVLCEEIGHHLRTVGNILNQNNVSNIKQERFARAWAFERLAPACDIRTAFASGCSTIWEVAERLSLPEEFLIDAIEYYKCKGLL